MRDVKLLKERARSTQYMQHSPQRPVGQWVMAVGIFGFGFVMGAATSGSTEAAQPSMSLEELADQTKALDTLADAASGDPRVAALVPEVKSEQSHANTPSGEPKHPSGVVPAEPRPPEHATETDKPVVTDRPSLTEALAGLQQELEPNAEIFTVQVSSFPTVEEAGAFAKQLERKGFEPYITAAEIPGRGTWHRVRVGNYRSIDGAETLRDRLASVDIAGLVLKARSR